MADNQYNFMDNHADDTPIAVESFDDAPPNLDRLADDKDLQENTFSHWPHPSSPSVKEMVTGGFHCCNTNDRVICLQCSLTCEKWTPYGESPVEVHRTLKPRCRFVRSRLPSHSQPLPVINTNFSDTVNAVIPAPDFGYAAIPQRIESFKNRFHFDPSLVDNLVRAGFFFNRENGNLTCFYCNGSLQGLTPNHDPVVEHVRHFPHCSYARQSCAEDLYRTIRQAEYMEQERMQVNRPRPTCVSSAILSDDRPRQLTSPNESSFFGFIPTLSDLGFHQTTIQQCWERQLRTKHEDFPSKNDLIVACMVAQKQFDPVQGTPVNIIIPSVVMQQLRERETASNDRIPWNICVLCRTEQRQ